MTQASVLIDNAKGYADQMVSAAESAMSNAQGALDGLWGAPQVYVPIFWTPQAPTALNIGQAPKLQKIVLDTNTGKPGETFKTEPITKIVTADGKPAPFKGIKPKFTTPSRPAGIPSAPGVVGINLNGISLPTAPPLIVPPDPILEAKPAPSTPTLKIPTFSGQRPPDIGPPPGNLSGVLRTEYRTAAPEFITMVNGYVDAELAKMNPQYHAQMARIEAQLDKYLNGGTALNPEVEEAIYNRARARNEFEARKVQDSVFADTAARGFTLPSGAMTSALARARQEAANNDNKTSNEIAIAQAEMEQKNLQFAVTTSTGLRTAMVSATMSYMQNIVALNGQASAYAQSMVNALIETYNSLVKLYAAKLEGYKADASVFQTLMQAAMAEVEIYKAEIQALQVLTEVDTAKVNVYRARIDSLSALASMYKTQVDAVVSVAGLERLKVDLYQAQIQAYSAQVSANVAEWKGYEAQISAENSKAQIYAFEAQAYAAEVQGYKASIEAKSEEVRAQALTNDAIAKAYVAKWDAYKISVDARGKVASTELENMRQEVIAYQYESNAKIAEYTAQLEYFKAASQIGITSAKTEAEVNIKNAELTMEHMKAGATLHQASATVHANLAGAALAGMNALAVESASTT